MAANVFWAFSQAVVTMFTSRHSPFPFERGNRRDVTPSRRATAASAGDRTRVAHYLLLAFGLAHDEAEADWSSDSSDGGSDEFSTDSSDNSSDTDSTSSSSSDDDEEPLSSSLFNVAFDELLAPPGAGDHPLQQRPPVTAADFQDNQLYEECRFTRAQFYLLLELLQLPLIIRGANGHKFEAEFALLVFLFRMANVRTFRSMREKFNREATEMCEVFNWVMLHINREFAHLVDGSLPPPLGWAYPSGLDRWQSQLATWNHAVNSRVVSSIGVGIPAMFGLICLFVDGTFKHVCRPGQSQQNVGFFANLQQSLYTRYKSGHGLIFQAVTAPTGIIVDFYGPGPGRQNDRWLVRESDLDARLLSLFGGVAYSCYGDSIYTITQAIVRRIRGAILQPWQSQINGALNRERTSVEHVFGGVMQNFKFLNFKYNHKLFDSACGAGVAFRCGALLYNLQTCMVGGNQVSVHFGVSPPDAREYMAGGARPQNIEIL
jgi:hypothetical protein